jgi:uncharacterized protein (TIGR02145 family)
LIFSCSKEDKNPVKPSSNIDNYAYKTVQIGDQVWMAENLKVTHFRIGDAIPSLTDNTKWINFTTGAYCNYENNVDNVATYGRLYNWYAVNDYRNIAPEGWHVPSDEEWKQLEMYLGMSQIEANKLGLRGTNEGGKLKEVGTAHWQEPNEGATNESGFTALPGGCTGYWGGHGGMGEMAWFWCSTESDSTAWSRNLYHDYVKVSRTHTVKQHCYSVRCIKDMD